MTTKNSIIISLACIMLMLVLTPLTMLNQPYNAIYAAEDNTPKSKASVLMEYGTGEILSEKNATEALPIASVTKTMTILLTLEALENGTLTPDQVIVASENAAGMGGSQVFIDANAEYTVGNLLRATIISSANDASVALAEELGGSEEGFVNLMNARAKELSLENTNYVNCTGLPAANHYSCAKDVAKITRELVKYPLYFDISKIWMEDFVHPSGRITQMANTNKLIRAYKGCDAGKTGSTSEAGYCLSATAERSNMRLISVVLGAPDGKTRFKECSDQFNWGFANYESKCLVDSTSPLDSVVNLSKSKQKTLAVRAEEDYYALAKKGEEINIKVNYELPAAVKAPIAQGDVVGKIILTKDDVVQKEINIVANENAEALSYWESIQDILNHWKIKRTVVDTENSPAGTVM